MGTGPVARREATALGALVAGLVSGGLLYGAAPVHLALLGSVVGLTSPSGVVVIWLVFSLLLGAAYGAFAGRVVDPRAGYASDTGYGLAFGAVAALVAGTVVVPALGGAAVPAVNGTVLVAYLLFGLVMGVGYGASLRGVVPTVGVGSERVAATLAGSLLGGLVSGAVLHAAARGFLVQFGILGGVGRDLASSFAVWVLVAVGLGAIYAVTAARTVGRGPGEALGHVKAGLVYGTVAAIVVGMVLVPLTLGAVGDASPPVPFVDSVVVASFVLYGLLLGAGYGAVTREGRTVPAPLAQRLGPTAVAGVAGAVAGGAVLGVATGPYYIVHLSLTAKLGPTLTAAVLAWLLLCLALAWVFVRYVAPGEEAISVTRSAVRRGVAFGAVVGGILLALLPVTYEAASGQAYAMSHQNPVVFVAYLLFGVGVGAGYGLHEEGLRHVEVGTRTHRAVVFGSLFGGFTGGLVIHQLAGPGWMLFFGSLLGTFTYTGAWLGWLAIALVLGAAFWYALARDLESYVAGLWDVVEGTGGLLERAMETGEVTTTATLLGLLFGVGAAVVVGMIAMPVAVTFLAPPLSMPLPTTVPMVIAGYVVYGLFLGLGYGTVLAD